MDPSDRKIKGRILQAYLKFIKKKWGEDGLEDCVKACRLPAPRTIAEDKWYPQKYGVDMAVWIQDSHGAKANQELGFAIATEKGVVSYVAWVAGINKIIDKFEDEFRNSVDYGAIELEREEKRTTIHMTDISSSPEGCNIYLGMLKGLLHIGRARNGSVEKRTCQHRGDRRCTYVLRWD